MVFKMQYTRSYGHVHCTLFAAKTINTTYANCGKLVVRIDEFEDMRTCMSGVEFVEKEDRLLTT